MSNMHTFDSLRKKEAGDDESKDNLYAGGAGQHGGSGLNVIGPDSAARKADDIFSKATEESKDGPLPSAEDENAVVNRLTFYRNGFQVDGGEFRALDDPANAAFLKDVNAGVVPRELAAVAGRRPVHIHLEDKRREDYVPPPPPAYVAFSGEGQTMGSSTTAPSGAVVQATGSADFSVDSTKPTTTLQIRLIGGKRLRAQFNLSHTVRDIGAYLETQGAASVPYVLMAGFPPAVIENHERTIEAAGLKGETIIQKAE